MLTYIRHQPYQVGCFLTDNEGNLIAKGLGDTERQATENAHNRIGKVDKPKTDQDKGIALACRVWSKKDFRKRVLAQAPKGDLKRIIRHMAKAWIREFRTKKKLINFGSCEEFALDVQRAFPAVEVIWEDYHCFVKYDGKFYDAECPEGVNSMQQLPFFKRH